MPELRCFADLDLASKVAIQPAGWQSSEGCGLELEAGSLEEESVTHQDCQHRLLVPGHGRQS